MVSWDSKIKERLPSRDTSLQTEESAPSLAQKAGGKASDQKTSEVPLEQDATRPKPPPKPERAKLHPVNIGPKGTRPVFEKEVVRLRALILGNNPTKLTAAAEALILCASYKMRRSKGARHMAVELCHEVAEEVSEFSVLATQLSSILEAEGDLHEVSARATLRACKKLIELIEAEGELVSK